MALTIIERETLNNRRNTLQRELDLKLQERNETETQGFKDPRSQAEKNNGPRPFALGSSQYKGYPKVPTLSRTKKATGIEIADFDSLLEVVCGKDSYVRRAIAKARMWATEVGQAIRKAIEAILAMISEIPGVQWFIDKVRKVAAFVREATKWLKNLNKGILQFIRMVKIIMGVIQWIISLPQRLLNLFRDCLAQAYRELARAAMEIVSEIAGGVSGAAAGAQALLAVQELQKSVTEFQATAAQTVSLVGQAANAFANPSNLSNEDAAKYFQQLSSPEGREQFLKDSFGGDTSYDKSKYKMVM